MGEPVSFKKIIDLTPNTLIKTSSSTLKGLLVIGSIAIAAWSIYVTFVKPHINPAPTTTQKAEAITNYNIQPKQTFFGCQHFRIMQEKIKNEKTQSKQTINGETTGLR